MSEPHFIHLQVHSNYSMINGLAKTTPLVKKAAALGMPALAITNFTNLCSLVKFYRAGHGTGIKPIIRADFNVQCNLLGDELTHLTVLAANNTSYQNLTLLISKAYQHRYSATRPIINHNWLIKLNKGLILLSSRHMGNIRHSLLHGNSTLVDECVTFYEEHFPDHYFLKLIHTSRPDEESYLHTAVELAEAHSLPIMATNNMHFINSSNFDTHKIHVTIHNSFTLNNPKHPRNYSPQQYIHSKEEMCKLFANIPEALANTIEITKHCNITVHLGEYFLPQFPTRDMSTKDYLVKHAKEGLEEHLAFLFPDKEEHVKHHPEYDKHLETELQVINQMGFPGYFLIIMEFIQWSKDNSVPVGPGHGSGAGSLVAYTLKITNLNPLEFDLLFKHFLNPEHVSMPDFNIDFCMEKHDQVIKHIADMYSHDTVSQIITFSTMAAKAVIHDIGHVLGHPYSFVNHISKLIPPNPGMTLAKAFEAKPQLPEIYKADEEVKALINMARKLEGVTHNTSKHTSGVVITPTKITNFAPLYCNEEGKHPVTQFDKSNIEYTRLVKFNFLGLHTLTIINWALEMINKQQAKNGKPPLDITTIPLDDKKSFNMLQHSETTAVFQLESHSMKDLIKHLQPDCFKDMITLVALFHPGPLQSGMVDNFINHKHGHEEISYPDIQWQHESLKPVLEPTYSIILYQEQVMQIAQVLSGYTLSGTDILHHAMGKKKPEEMAKQHSVFAEGAEKNRINTKLAMKIFNLVEKFTGYRFNKSHSAAYALVSYQTLWLKAHYPAEFIAAVMTTNMDNTKKVVGLVDECWQIGLKILPPDINSSLYHFHINNNSEIMYGIGTIKGVSEGPIEAIIKAHNKGSYFHELFDLCAQTNTKKLNQQVLEKLIMSRAFDHLGPHHTALMNSLGNALKAADQHTKAEAISQANMFSMLAKEPEQIEQSYTSCQPWPEQVVLDGEHETLGLYLTGHPINQYLKEIEHYVRGIRLKDMHPTEHGKVITAAGLIVATQVMVTKHSNHISICTLDDHSRQLEVMLFTDTLDKYQQLLEKDHILIISRQVSFDDFSSGLKMTTREVMDIDKAQEKYAHRLAISLTDRQIDDQLLNQLHQSLEPHHSGTIPVHLYYQRADAHAQLHFGTTWHVSPSNHLLNNLHGLIGSEQVELEFD